MSVPLIVSRCQVYKTGIKYINRWVETYPKEGHAILIMNTGLITCFKDDVHLRNKLQHSISQSLFCVLNHVNEEDYTDS
jgi:hypothetical protein